jgi:uroporphyrinogen decarboxylase
MTPKENILAVVNFKTPESIPVDLNATHCTSIHRVAYDNLKAYLNVNKENKMMMNDLQLCEADDEVLEKLAIDTRGVHGKPDHYEKAFVGERAYIDHFGTRWEMPEHCLYYDMVAHPLAGLETLDQVKKRMKWPDPYNEKTIEGIRERARALHEENKYAVVGDMVHTGIFEPSHYIRGFEDFLVDIVLNRDIACYILENVLAFQKARIEMFLDEVGEYLDIVFIGDDVAAADGPIVSPKLYRELVKPYQKDYFSFIKSKTKAKLMYHSCGNVMPLIEDFIDMGVDILNPIQVSARDMDIRELKRRYGDVLCFWGGIDTTRILPGGTVKEVEEAVLRTVDILGPEGYVVAAVHNIQADVPAQNITAMFRTAKTIKC